MTAIPQRGDPTISAIEAKFEGREGRLSGALGMGSLGPSCNRKVWYSFRWFVRPSVSFKTQLIFDSGFRAEAAVAKYLSEVLEIHTIDPASNYQYGFSDFGGHFKGFMDGVVRGLVQAPATWHVWDNKETKQEKFDEFKSIVVEYGEKMAVEKWNFGYYIQAQLYMHYAEISRHYMTVTTCGVRDIATARTEYNKNFAEAQVGRARRIVFSDKAPEKIAQAADHFECRWCEYKMVCHGNARPFMNCRTCVHSRPEQDGTWSCRKKKTTLSKEDQRKGCEEWTTW